MCFGNNGIDMPDPMEVANANIAEMQAQYDFDTKTRTDAATAAAAADTKSRADWDTQFNTNKDTARSWVTKAFVDEGLDPKLYADEIDEAVNLAASNMQYGGSNQFSTDLGSNTLNDVRNTTVNDNTKAVNAFAPVGFETDLWADTADDAFVNSVLDEQFNEGAATIQRAFDRGQLSQQGFDAAMGELNTQKAGANSSLQTIGSGVMTGYETALGTMGNNARTAANNWDFGDPFDANKWNTDITGKRDTYNAGFEGDFRNAVGDQQFFDINAIIAKGGIGQGAQNTGVGGNLLEAIGKRQEDEQQPRGLGTQGSF